MLMFCCVALDVLHRPDGCRCSVSKPKSPVGSPNVLRGSVDVSVTTGSRRNLTDASAKTESTIRTPVSQMLRREP